MKVASESKNNVHLDTFPGIRRLEVGVEKLHRGIGRRNLSRIDRREKKPDSEKATLRKSKSLTKGAHSIPI